MALVGEKMARKNQSCGFRFRHMIFPGIECNG